MCSALAHLKTKQIVHRDLKPENLLYVDDGDDADVKVADFGLAHHFLKPDDTDRAHVGTVPYMAPEVVESKPHSYPVDVWSLGVCLFTLLGGYMPFDPSSGAPDREVRRACCHPIIPLHRAKPIARGRLHPPMAPRQVKRRILACKPAFDEKDDGYPQQWEHVSPEARGVMSLSASPSPHPRLFASRPVASSCSCSRWTRPRGDPRPRPSVPARFPSPTQHGSPRSFLLWPASTQLTQDATRLCRSTPEDLLKEPWISGKAGTTPLPGSDDQLRRFNEVCRSATQVTQVQTLSRHSVSARHDACGVPRQTQWRSSSTRQTPLPLSAAAVELRS